METLESRELLSSGPYEPYQIRTAYGFNTNDTTVNATIGNGSGQTIAIVDLFNNPVVFNDLDQFDSLYGLTSTGPKLFQQFGPASSFLSVIDQNGNKVNPSDPTLPVDPTGSFESEIMLDVEWAHVIAPAAKLVLVEALPTDPTFDPTSQAIATAAKQPGVSVVSMSFGGGATIPDSIFTTPKGHQGVTFLASSGDNGSTGTVEAPASSQNVVAVGGTSLFLNADDSYQSEIGWGFGDLSDTLGGSGGGYNPATKAPRYQLSIQNALSAPSLAHRSTPDVSFLADPSTGVFVYDSYSAGGPVTPSVVGGTSLSCPCWAALIAIANQGRVSKSMGTLDGVSQTLPLLYGLPDSDFRDVTSGSNGAFSAGPGYDEVTGRGSPIVPQVVNDLELPLTLAPNGVTYIYLSSNGTLNRYDLSGWSNVATGVKSYQLQPVQTPVSILITTRVINDQYLPFAINVNFSNGLQAQESPSGVFNFVGGAKQSALATTGAYKGFQLALTSDGTLEGNNGSGFVILERNVSSFTLGSDGGLYALTKSGAVTQSTHYGSFGTLTSSGVVSMVLGADGILYELMKNGSVTRYSTISGLWSSNLVNGGVVSLTLLQGGVLSAQMKNGSVQHFATVKPTNTSPLGKKALSLA